MGMYDLVRVEDMASLPERPVWLDQAAEFQTKDFGGLNFDHYEIRGDGSLWSDRKGAFQHGPMEPWAHFCGGINFYTSNDKTHGCLGDDWYEVTAIFWDGKLIKWKRIRSEDA